MRNARQREGCQILCRLTTSRFADGATGHMAPDDVHDFDVDQMGRAGDMVDKPMVECRMSTRPQQVVDQNGRIYDDHVLSRTSRMISAEDSLSSTGSRLRTRARSSSTVGCSADFRISRNKYSDKLCPASAALDFSFRCRSSGTFRIWIITDM